MSETHPRDFVLYLNSADQGTHPLEPGVTTVRAAFRQELERPLTLRDDWKVALLSLVYTHSYGNAVLKSPQDFHYDVKDLSQVGPPLRTLQLSPHKHFTHVGQVLEDLVEQLQLPVIPTLSGGTHHYGQLHMETPGTTDMNFPTDPKLDYFRRDLVDTYLATHGFGSLPTTFPRIKQYINDATLTLMGADQVKYVWTLLDSPTRPTTHYAIDMWAEGYYDLGESLALFMGFLEPDPTRPGQTRIVAHKTAYADTGAGTQGDWVISRLDLDHGGIIQEDYQLGGVRIHLNIPIERLHYMFEKRAVFDMGAWIQDPSPFTPHMRGASPLVLVSLEPDRWGLQAAPLKSVRFAHGLEKVVGAASVTGRLQVLPNLQTPLGNDIVLSNVDFSKCYVELDIVELSVTGGQQRHVLGTVPLPSQTYGQTCAYYPQHLDFRALAAPTRHLNQLRVHLRNADNRGIPFYTGLVGLLLYFHRSPTPTSLTSLGMSFQGGRRVTLESNAQKEVFPNNHPAEFRLRLPEMWKLDSSWEVGLVQLLLPHTWHNILDRQVPFRVHYNSTFNVSMYLPAGAYVTIQDVVEGWMGVMEANIPQNDRASFTSLKVALDGKGFYTWTFPDAEFSVYIPAWLARVLGYLEWETWNVPFYYRSNQRHPTVEITQRDANGRPTEVELTRSHTMAKHSQTSVWATISKNSFQNIYVHCDIIEPVYIGSQMAKVILTHGVNTKKQRLEDVFIPHLIFYPLSQLQFRDIKIDIRDNLGRPIPFQGGEVTATLYFRRRTLP